MQASINDTMVPHSPLFATLPFSRLTSLAVKKKVHSSVETLE